MAYRFSMTDRLNAANVAGSQAAHVYMLAKSYAALQTDIVPTDFVTKVAARIASASDPSDLAYLLSAFEVVRGADILSGAWWRYRPGEATPLGQQAYPILTEAYLAAPDYTITAEGKLDLDAPSWWRPSTLLRVRLWGAGGAGAGGATGSSTVGAVGGGGGGGGGYIEAFVPLRYLQGATLVVGNGGAQNSTPGSTPGSASYLTVVDSNGQSKVVMTANGGAGGTAGSSGGSPGSAGSGGRGTQASVPGMIAVLARTGGNGGRSKGYIAGGGGGGSAGGPWGFGFDGGATLSNTGGSGAGTGGTPATPDTATAVDGGPAATTDPRWFSALFDRASRPGSAASVVSASGFAGAAGGSPSASSTTNTGGFGNFFGGGGGAAYPNPTTGNGRGGVGGVGGGGGGAAYNTNNTPGGSGGDGYCLIEAFTN